MSSNPLSANELREAFFSPNLSKSARYDEEIFNVIPDVIKKYFGVLNEPLNLARVTPVFNLVTQKKLAITG